MASTQSADSILKADSLARVRTPPERKRELMEEFERSGLSGAKFAALAGVKYSTFAGWMARRKGAQSSEAISAPALDAQAKVRWLEAVVEQARKGARSGHAVLTIQFGSAARAEIADADQAELAAALLRALNQPPPSC